MKLRTSRLRVRVLPPAPIKGYMIVNEDFADNVAKIVEKLENQIGENSVLGCSMFFLTKQPDGMHKWVVVSNYQEGLTDSNIVYLHQSVAKHIARDFTNITYGPDS